jgi:hypothetical protein
MVVIVALGEIQGCCRDPTMYVHSGRTQTSESMWRMVDSAQRGPPRLVTLNRDRVCCTSVG